MTLRNLIFSDKETETLGDIQKRQRAMRDLNETTSQIREEGELDNPDQYYLNRLRKQFLNQERKAMKRGGNREKISNYRKTAGYYIRL